MVMFCITALIIFNFYLETISTFTLNDVSLFTQIQHPFLHLKGPHSAHYISSGKNRFETLNEKVRPALEVPLPGGGLDFLYPEWLFEKMEEQLEPFELEDFLQGRFIAKGWNGTWISDDSFIFAGNDGNVYKLDMRKRVYAPYFSSEVLKKFPGPSVSVTNDGQYILIRHDAEPVFRHSTRAQFTIYDVINDKYYDVADKKLLQTAKWAPEGHGLVYVLENNIYYVSSPETATQGEQITFDGVPGLVYNGIPDWVYEEEVLLAGSALWFSPDGKKLAFAQLDDTNVEKFHYILYGTPGAIEDQYPQVATIRYPKAGTPNPIAKLKCALLDEKKLVDLDVFPTEYITADNILQRVTWANNDEVAGLVLNRTQNIATLTKCNVLNNHCELESVFDEERGWLDLDEPIYGKNGTMYVMRVSQLEGGDTYKHLVLYNTGRNTFSRLTRGKRVVSTIYGWDQERNLIYYGSTLEDQPSQEHIFVVSSLTGEDKCLTCDFQTPEGTCRYATPAFSKKFSYFAKGCQGHGPNFIVVQNSQDDRDLFLWEGNEELRAKLRKKRQPIIEDIKINLGESVARARLLLPEDMDRSGKTKYPLIVDVYAGPNFNRILDAFSIGFEHYLVTKKHYIVAFIDGRGSGRMGDRNLFSVYRALGNKEVLDQIQVTKFLQENYPVIDPERTAIWGWSYGGFASIWALAKDTDNVFKMGLAVAPVVDFIYYDTIYTERYMGLPTKEDNAAGYNETDVTRDSEVEKLRNKVLFLIHGNADDNVHYQQSMLLSKALERNDILFYQQSYPDETHNLANVFPHLYHTMDKYFSYGLRPKGKCKIEKAWDCTDRF